MPPRPHEHMGATKDVATNDSKLTSMPPPPNPPPRAILEPEVTALSTCLKNATVKTAQIYGFYADTRRLGIEAHAPKPPRSLTSALGREVEKFDQLVDAMESHILQAIAVLQRDLIREEKRVRLAEEASVATRTRSKTMSLTPTSTRIPLPLTTDSSTSDVLQPLRNASLPTPTNSPPVPSSSAALGRRPSAISISSLHRPAFPPKLDLSSAALRISAEEASMFSNGLSSPVTLAPKSARAIGPNEYPPDLMAFVSSNQVLERPVDIDLTMSDANATSDVKLLNVGNTADKPIVLDLDAMDIDMAMTDLFGEADDTGPNTADAPIDGLFPSIAEGASTNPDNAIEKSDKQDVPFLNALGPSNNDDDIFGSLDVEGDSSESQQVKNELSESRLTSSPSALLASFGSTSQLQAMDPLSSNNGNMPEVPFGLGLDFSNLSPGFFDNSTDSFSMEMNRFLAIGPPNAGKDDNEEKKVDATGF